MPAKPKPAALAAHPTTRKRLPPRFRKPFPLISALKSAPELNQDQGRFSSKKVKQLAESCRLNITKVNRMETGGRFPLVIAAAGRSSRFGRPKLLEVIPGQTITLIEHVVRECLAGDAGPIIVVLGPQASEPYGAIAARVATAGAHPLHVDPAPEEMRRSIEHGIGYVESCLIGSPDRPPDFIGFMPADLPAIEAAFVRELIAQCRGRQESLVRGVTREGRGLHPVALRWNDRGAIAELPKDAGLNALWQNPRLSRSDFFCAFESMRHDLDNPQDWQKFPFPRDRPGE
ncbi:NTP transferase domain-containing protein [bacterium]|nr:NTP transferase domain-containing protein [bacterium]